jgi:hypothetical protein
METLWILLLGFLLRPKLGIGLGLLLVVIGLYGALRLEWSARREQDVAYGRDMFWPENLRRDAQGRLLAPNDIPDPRDMDPAFVEQHMANARMIGYAKYPAYGVAALGCLLALVCLGRWIGLVPMPALPEEMPENVEGKPDAKAD